MTNRIYKGNVTTAYYQTAFDRPVHVTFKDGSKKRFEAPYFDNALDFFSDEKFAYAPCEWSFNEKGEMFLTLK